MKNMMKKTVAAICLSAAVLISVPAVSLAETAVEPANQQESGIAPHMTYIVEARCALSVSDDIATVDCWVKGDVLEATKTKVIAELQVKNGSNWIPTAIWTDTQDGFKAHVNETKSVVIGHTYRVKATVTAWEGSQSETQTIFTDEMTA